MIKVIRILKEADDNRLAVIGAIDGEHGYLIGVIDGTKFTSARNIEQCSLKCSGLRIEYSNTNGVRTTDMYTYRLMPGDEYKICTTIITNDKMLFYQRMRTWDPNSTFICRELSQSKYEIDTLLEEDETEGNKPLMCETYKITEDCGNNAWFDKTDEFKKVTGITAFDKVEVLLYKTQYAHETKFNDFDGEIRLYTCGKCIEISSSECLNFVVR